MIGLKHMTNENNNVFEQRTIKNIAALKSGDKFTGIVKIMRKSHPGPVIFTVSNGYGVADAVIKDSAFNVDDIVEISGYVNERAGKIQIEI